MNYRRSTFADYDALHAVRMAVRENILVNTSAVTPEIYKEMLEQKGAGWVCEDESGKVVGFAIVDLSRRNIWALFVHPDVEGNRIGAALHKLMLDWSFEQGAEKLWLTTDVNTRAERFYEKAGWDNKGLDSDGEVRFEITKSKWLDQCANS